MALLMWTYHPLVDVGVATLCAMSNRRAPEEVTSEDLEKSTDEIAEAYFSGLLISYLTCVYMNSAYVQPAMKPDRRASYRDRYLKAFRSHGIEDSAHTCSFCDRPSAELIHRGQVPLLTGQDTLNFLPGSLGGLPACGACLTALQCIVFGCKRVEGKLLGVHVDEPALNIDFACLYLRDNRRLLSLARAGMLPHKKGPSPSLDREQMGPTFPDSKSPGSLITSDLLSILERSEDRFQSHRSLSITCYWLSSSGQGPSLEVFHLPSNLLRFLRKAHAAPYGPSWSSLVASAWRPPDPKTDAAAGGPGRSRNDILDDIVNIYRDGMLDRSLAAKFIRRYLLGVTSPQANALKRRTEWGLTELFLREVLGMTKQRIERIKDFADRLAGFIAEMNDRRLFRDVVFSNRSWVLRTALTRAQRREAHDKNLLLFGLDDYLGAFEADDAARFDNWDLVRDLISIRLVETLHERNFFDRDENKELLAEPEEAAE